MSIFVINLPISTFKWLIALLIGSGFAAGLFVIMQILISPKDLNLTEYSDVQMLEYVRVKRAEQIREKKRELPPKEPPKAQPPPPRPQIDAITPDAPAIIALAIPSFKIPLSLSQGNGLDGLGALVAGGNDGNVMPLVRVEPMYPRNARIKGVEGWVKVGITIDKTGAVEKVDIIDSEPKRAFDRATIRAVKRWKFKPEIVDGKAIKNYSTQVINFKLTKKK